MTFVHGSKRYFAHRAIWAMHHGPIPDGYVVDHIDGNPLNNRIENLRAVPPAINQRNLIRADHRNKSGLLGVHAKTRGGKTRYYARISINGKSVALGAYATPEEAASAYLDARSRYFPDYFSAQSWLYESFDPCI